MVGKIKKRDDHIGHYSWMEIGFSNLHESTCFFDEQL